MNLAALILPVLVPLQGTAVHQIGAYSALVTGDYDGTMPIGRVLSPNALGLGTYNGLDGEAVLLEGKAYRVNGLGDANVVSPKTKTPFAFAVEFKPTLKFRVKGPMSVAKLTAEITRRVGDPELGFLAIRVDGEFSAVTGRSFAAQLKPYRPFPQIKDQQSVYSFAKLSGTLVGYHMPTIVADRDQNVPGYHFHFLSQDRTTGGHLLSGRVANATVRVMRADQLVAAQP